MSDYENNQAVATETPASQTNGLGKKLFATVAVVIAAIVLFVPLGNGIPSKVEKEVEQYFLEGWGHEVTDIEKIAKISSKGNKEYVIGGKLTGSGRWRNNYFVCYVIDIDNEILVVDEELFEDKSEYKETKKELKEVAKDHKDELKDTLDELEKVKKELGDNFDDYMA